MLTLSDVLDLGQLPTVICQGGGILPVDIGDRTARRKMSTSSGAHPDWIFVFHEKGWSRVFQTDEGRMVSCAPAQCSGPLS